MSIGVTIAVLLIPLLVLSINTMYDILDTYSVDISSYREIPFSLLSYHSMKNITEILASPDGDTYISNRKGSLASTKSTTTSGNGSKHDEKKDQLTSSFLHFYNEVLNAPFLSTNN